MTIKRITEEEAKKLKGRTKWEEVDKLTDEQIEEAARCDSDSALPTDEELRDFKPAKKRRKEKHSDGNSKSQKR